MIHFHNKDSRFGPLTACGLERGYRPVSGDIGMVTCKRCLKSYSDMPKEYYARLEATERNRNEKRFYE